MRLKQNILYYRPCLELFDLTAMVLHGINNQVVWAVFEVEIYVNL